MLEDVLVPELESDWAQTMGTQMALMLQHIEGRGEREPRFMAEENAKLEDVLAKANGALGEEAVAVPEQPAEGTLEALREHNAALREAITRRSTRPTRRGSTASNDLPADRLGITRR